MINLQLYASTILNIIKKSSILLKRVYKDLLLDKIFMSIY